MYIYGYRCRGWTQGWRRQVDHRRQFGGGVRRHGAQRRHPRRRSAAQHGGLAEQGDGMLSRSVESPCRLRAPRPRPQGRGLPICVCGHEPTMRVLDATAGHTPGARDGKQRARQGSQAARGGQAGGLTCPPRARRAPAAGAGQARCRAAVRRCFRNAVRPAPPRPSPRPRRRSLPVRLLVFGMLLAMLAAGRVALSFAVVQKNLQTDAVARRFRVLDAQNQQLAGLPETIVGARDP